MIRLQALLPGLLLVLCASAQSTPTGYTIDGRFDSFTTDEIGNVYALQGDELRLFDARGRSWLRNSVKSFGRIGSIDPFYSLKPMVFAPEQGQLAVLDNTLSVQGSIINLPRMGYPQVVLACMSVQSHFWFFDQRELAFVRMDGQLRPVTTTGRLDQVVGITPTPLGMLEYDSRLYVNDPMNGVLVFDLFGTYMRTIPIKGIHTFEVRGQGLFHFTDSGYHVYDMRSFESIPVPLPEDLGGPVRDVRAEHGLLYVLLADRIVVRPITAP